jgi:hypothetical protein
MDSEPLLDAGLDLQETMGEVRLGAGPDHAGGHELGPAGTADHHPDATSREPGVNAHDLHRHVLSEHVFERLSGAADTLAVPRRSRRDHSSSRAASISGAMASFAYTFCTSSRSSRASMSLYSLRAPSMSVTS